MSAIGERGTDSSGTTGTTPPGPHRVTAAVLRGVLAVAGALSLVGGLTWLLLNMYGPHPAVDLLVGVVVSAGGLVLLMPHRFRLPRRTAVVGAAAAAVLGTCAGLAAHATQVCCSFAYVDSRGFPWPLIRRGAVAETSETARNLALAANWQLDVVSLAADVLFWAHAGLLLTAAVVLTHRTWAARHP